MTSNLSPIICGEHDNSVDLLKTVVFFEKPKLVHGGNYIREGKDSAKSTCLIFSPKEDDSVGALGKYLKLFAVSTIYCVQNQNQFLFLMRSLA